MNKFDSTNKFKIFLDITTKCNLNCSYCVSRANKEWDKEIYLNNFNYILKLFKKTKEKFSIILFGGEPLMHTNINYIYNSLLEMNHDLIILSNGLLKLDYTKYLKNNILCFTFHFQIDLFIDNMKKIIEKGFKDKILINIILDKPESKILYDFCIKNKIRYNLTMIYDTINENIVNLNLLKEFNEGKPNEVKLFQEYPRINKNFNEIIEDHYKYKNSPKICFFNEAYIDIDLNYEDECRNIKENLKENPYIILNHQKYSKPIHCNKICGDCYGKIVCEKTTRKKYD